MPKNPNEIFPEHLQIITINLDKAAVKVGLKIRQDKTKFMVQQSVIERTSDEIKVEVKQLKLGTNSNILKVLLAHMAMQMMT